MPKGYTLRPMADQRVGPPAAELVETEIDGNISLYAPGREQVTILNGSASDIWRLSDGQHTLDEIVSLLAAAYRADEQAIRADVTATIDRFRADGLFGDADPT